MTVRLELIKVQVLSRRADAADPFVPVIVDSGTRLNEFEDVAGKKVSGPVYTGHLTTKVGPNDLHTVIELLPRPLQRYPPVCHHVCRLQTLRTARGCRDRLFKGMGDSDGDAGVEGKSTDLCTPSHTRAVNDQTTIRTCCHPVRRQGHLARVDRNQCRRWQSRSTHADGWADKTKRADLRLPWSAT